MYTSTAALTILSLSLAVYAQTPAELEGSLPQCATECASTGASMNGCGVSDFACTCSKYGAMKTYVAPCLATSSACTGEQINNMFSTIDSICSNYYPLSWNNPPPPADPAQPSAPAVPSPQVDPAALAPSSAPAAPTEATTSPLAPAVDPASAPVVPMPRGMAAPYYSKTSTMASTYAKPTGYMPSGSGAMPKPSSTSTAPFFEGAAERFSLGFGTLSFSCVVALAAVFA